jgi:hypothetical protein
MLALLDAIAAGRVSREQLGPAREKRLLESAFPAVNKRAAAALPKSP